MGESEQLTQREELKNWLGRLSYILHRSDELHENLNGIRGQYRYADYLQIWKRPQFFANTARCVSWVFLVLLVVLFIAVANGSLLAAMCFSQSGHGLLVSTLACKSFSIMHSGESW